jgi:hypothetical protein
MAAKLNGEGGSKFEHIQYDAVSYAGMREANLANFGARLIPSYDFSKAKTIVSVGADFLSTWLLPTEFAVQYGKTRNPEAAWMSKHFQFESVLSVTGSNADVRGMIKPSEEAAVLAYMIKALGGNPGVAANAGSWKAAADKAGRDSTRVIAALPVCVTNDREAALQRAAQVFVVYGQLPSYRAMLDKEGAAGPADIAIIGSASEVADRIMALAEIGVTDFAAVEFGATPDEVAETRAMVKSLLK